MSGGEGTRLTGGAKRRRRGHADARREWLARVDRGLDRARQRVDQWPLSWSCAFVFLPLLAVYLSTASFDTTQSPDPVAAAVPAWQYTVHGTFDLDAFDGELAWFVEGQHHVVSDRMPGIIFFAIPFYWALPTSAAEPSLVPAAVAAATASAAAMTVLHGLFRRLVSTSTALVATLAGALGTATWTVSADGLWPHGIDQLWLASALLGLATAAWSASGVFFGLAVFTRPHMAIAAAVAGLASTWTTRSLRPAALIGVTSLAGLGALLAYNVRMFGELSLIPGYLRRPEGLLPPSSVLEYVEGVAGTLVSPDRGVLVLTPLLLPLLPGLGLAWRAAPSWARAGALSGVGYMVVQLAVNRFSGGDNFFSYRLPLEMLTLGAPLLLLAWREWTARTPLRRTVFWALVGVSVLVHSLGAIFWQPIFEERSPWTNVKVLEALRAAGMEATPLIAAIVGVTVLLTLQARRRRP